MLPSISWNWTTPRGLGWLILGLGTPLFVQCTPGGSHRPGRAALLQVELPEAPPRESPEWISISRVQPIGLIFDGPPPAAALGAGAFAIRDAQGLVVPGNWHVNGHRATFYPQLPTSGHGGAFEANARYVLDLGPTDGRSFLSGIAPALRNAFPHPDDPESIRIEFRVTDAPRYQWNGYGSLPATLANTDPVDGATDFSPGLHCDHDHDFPPRQSILLNYDRPIHPASILSRFVLRDLETKTPRQLHGISLGIAVRLVQNSFAGSTIELSPSGILPLGHCLAVEGPRQLPSLSDRSDSAPHEVLLTVTVARRESEPIHDCIHESFDQPHPDNRQHQEPGETLAQWHAEGRELLAAASLGPPLTETLGLFHPPPSIEEVTLDTSRQVFPLPGGSTPDVVPGTIVEGGAFAFDEIVIPDGVTVRVVGPRPLILTSLGSVRWAGRLDLRGASGTSETAFDSAITPLPGGIGGAGGGRGGEGHPTLLSATGTPVSPPRGGSGFGPHNQQRIGGQGGESGMLDLPDWQNRYATTAETDPSETSDRHSNGFKPPGGGGGSFHQQGATPRKAGWGNVLADGHGGYLVRTPKHGSGFDILRPGEAGNRPFVDGRDDNDFLGPRGEFSQLFAGQGGGAGGSGLDSYFHGAWCHHDHSSSNDSLCVAEFGIPGSVPDTTGDSRGGAGGGGGGGAWIRSLGPILVESTAQLMAHGGEGGGGETLGCSNWAGGGGGGSGGAIILETADALRIAGHAVLDVSGGRGARADRFKGALTSCRSLHDNTAGAGGAGGNGLIHLRLPPGRLADVASSAELTPGAWEDGKNERNPAELGTISAAVSRWYDFGRAIAESPGRSPQFRFPATDASGAVITNADGNVLEEARAWIRCDVLGSPDPRRRGHFLPGLEPRAHALAPGTDIRVFFQGADAIATGSREVDPATISAWTTNPRNLDGHQFLRYRIRFERSPVFPLSLQARMVVQEITIDASF